MHSLSRIPEVISADPKGKTRVLLDSNAWRYVVDAQAQGRLLRAASGPAFRLQIAPAILYEALRMSDPGVKGKLVRLMTNPRFQRLMTEAYAESMEMLLAFEVLLPSWFRDKSDLSFFHRLRKDWSRKTGGFWVRCAENPDLEMNRINALGDRYVLEAARAQYEDARKQMHEANLKSVPNLSEVVARPTMHVPGWDGSSVAVWRIETYVAISFALRRHGDAYRDWIGPFVELDQGLIAGEAWGRFWMHSVSEKMVPRQWLRWAHSFQQRFRKVTTGSPGDTQLFSYLVETDVIVTADRVLIDMLEECRPYSPVALPTGKLIRAGRDGVEDLFSFLND